MSEIERLLEPIPGDNPAGRNLRYPLHDKIKEARRQDDFSPKGPWEEREGKTADFKQVIKVAEEALLKTTKDLWVGAWLTEAWIYEYGIPGLTSGLQLLNGLIGSFWDNLFPELDDGDPEPRVGPLDWIGSYFDPSKGSSPILAIRSVPLTESGFNWFVYQESRRVGYEAEVTGNKARVEFRQAAIEEKKVTPEQFDKDFEETPKPFYKELESDCKAAIEALDDLDRLCREKFGDIAPSFTPLRRALEEVGNVVHILLLKKLEKEPDPVDGAAAASKGEPAAEAQPASTHPAGLAPLEAGEITSGEQAILHVVAAAQFIRRKTPASPVPYLLLRALRWGEVRGAGESGLTDLPAPLPEIRMSLKISASGKNWARVLEETESAMSSTIGRGWLDLQRYCIKACDELGYSATAKSLRSELKALLSDFPQLANATLNDDTGTANPETLAWMRSEGFIA